MITSFFHISGMHCVSCVQTIEDIVARQPHIKNFKVYFPLNLLIVEHEEKLADVDKQINKQLKLSGYTLKKINLDEVITQPKKSLLHLLSRLVIILCLLLLLHSSHFIPYFSGITQTTIGLLISIFLILFAFSFKYIFQLINEIKTHNLGMGTFISIALILTASNFIINIYTNKNYSSLRDILSSYTMILFFVELGKGICEFIRLKFLKEYLKNFEVLKKMVIVKNKDGYTEKMIKDIKENDMVIVKAGDTIYFDGKIVKGSSHINESIVTGEAEPLFKKEGDIVFSGSQNLNGIIEMEVRNSFFKSYLGIIYFYILQNLSDKTNTQQIISKFLKFFVVGELLLIVIAVFYHINKGILYAFEKAVTLALLSCPCAFGIAIPLVLVAAYLLSSKNNVLLRNPNILEIFKNTKFLIMDKTGILTNAKQCVVNYEFLNSCDDLLNVLYTISRLSNHPRSVALNNLLLKINNNLRYMENVKCEEIPARGFKCIYNNKLYFLGGFGLVAENYKKLEELSEKLIDRSLYFFTENEMIAVFDLQEETSLKTKKIMSLLNEKYQEIAILSGDKFNKVKECARQLGITTFYAEKMPIEKLDIVKKYKENGITAFIGDGLNDAFVLKEADIGISVGGAIDLAKNSADVILLDNDLTGILKLDRLSHIATMAIKTNIIWAVLYNVIFIPLGFGIFHSIHISPIIASILMSGSSILLTINSFLFLKLANK